MEKTIDELKKDWKLLSKRDGEPCVYCGLLSTEKEHVFPKSWIERAKELDFLGFKVDIPEEVIVPACRECNMIAFDRNFSSFFRKKRFIQSRLKEKYARIMKQEIWTEDDINELSGKLRESVFYHNEINKLIQKRINNLP